MEPLYSCHWRGQYAIKGKIFFVPSCKYVYFYPYVGNYNTGVYQDKLPFWSDPQVVV